jgi:hypothetical protein
MLTFALLQPEIALTTQQLDQSFLTCPQTVQDLAGLDCIQQSHQCPFGSLGPNLFPYGKNIAKRCEVSELTHHLMCGRPSHLHIKDQSKWLLIGVVQVTRFIMLRCRNLLEPTLLVLGVETHY